jgi:hypothetical protein
VTLRRYAPIKPSRGTTWPIDVRRAIEARDPWCVGPLVGMPGECAGPPELDHVRASHAIGMKSRSTVDNGVRLCGFHHRIKTNAGRTWRPALLDYLARVEDPHAAHVDPCGLDCRASVPPA